MLALKFQIEAYRPQQVLEPAQRATFRNLGHAAATIRKEAVASIEPAEGPSPVGTPPHTHTAGVTKKGRPRKGELQRAIQYAVDAAAEEAVIGPRESVVGLAGYAHELGKEHMGQDFPERPYMGPALEDNADRIAPEWAGSIG